MSGWSETTRVLLALSAMLFAGFCMTRVTKKLRRRTSGGYITAGILIGPSVLSWIPGDLILHMEFLSDTALAFIAFGVGQFFRREAVRSVGKKDFGDHPGRIHPGGGGRNRGSGSGISDAMGSGADFGGDWPRGNGRRPAR